MRLKKFFWVLRAIIYKLRLKRVGNLSYIGKPLGIVNGKKISLGNKVRIFPNARLETYDDGEIMLEDNVSIAQNFHCTSKSGILKIGSGTVIAPNVFITNIDHEYTNPHLSISEQDLLYKKTEIGENCFIGFGAGIQAGTKLGKHCVVGANSVVRGDFPDYSVIVGSPGKIVKKYHNKENKWRKYDE